MINKYKLLLLGVLSCLTVNVNSAPATPGDALIETNNFTTKHSLKSLDTISESLSSFKGIVTKSENEEIITLNNFKHTDWEMQNIGIPNNISIIKGTLLHQRYVISKLEYENAILQKLNKDKVNKLKEQLSEDKKQFEDYQNSMRRVD